MNKKIIVRQLENAIYMDQWPNSAVLRLFGITTSRQFAALQRVYRRGEITDDQLVEVAGNGAKLTDLVNGCPGNPFPGIKFDDFEQIE